MFNSDHPLNIDHCGKVDIISEHAAMLIFYFLPLANHPVCDDCTES